MLDELRQEKRLQEQAVRELRIEMTTMIVCSCVRGCVGARVRECVRARQPATHQQASRPASLASNQPAGWCQPTCPPAPPPSQPANASHTTASSWRPLTSRHPRRHPPCRPAAGADCVHACLHVGVWHSGVLGPRDRAARRRSGDGRRLRRLQQ